MRVCLSCSMRMVRVGIWILFVTRTDHSLNNHDFLNNLDYGLNEQLPLNSGQHVYNSQFLRSLKAPS